MGGDFTCSNGADWSGAIEGRVVFAGSSSELSENEELMHRFLGV